jgi:hypothetical protein
MILFLIDLPPEPPQLNIPECNRIFLMQQKRLRILLSTSVTPSHPALSVFRLSEFKPHGDAGRDLHAMISDGLSGKKVTETGEKNCA